MTSFSRLEMISRVFFPLNISNGSTIEVTLQLIVAVSANSSSKLFHVCIASSSIISHVKFHKTTKRRPSTFYKRLQNCSNQASIEIQRGRFSNDWKNNFRNVESEFLFKFYKEFLSSSGYSLGTMLQINSNFLEWNQSRRISRLMETWVARHGNRAALRKENSVRGEERKNPPLKIWGRKRLARTNLWPVWSS